MNIKILREAGWSYSEILPFVDLTEWELRQLCHKEGWDDLFRNVVEKRIIALFDNGMNFAEITRHILNVSTSYVTKVCHENGRFFKPKPRVKVEYKNETRICQECGKSFNVIEYSNQKYCSLQCQRKHFRENGDTNKTLNDIQEWLSSHRPHLIYVSGYRNSESLITVRCVRCGHEFTLWGTTIRNKSKKCECPECVKREREERQRRKRLANIKITHINTSGMKVLDIRYCKECGKMFEAKGNAKYCSNACRKRVANRSHDHRIKPEAMVDKDITLKRLAERDNNICHICGLPVDWHDNYNGKYYPSIDHVIPLAKGGLHSWQNVKLAHRKCNTIKRDKVVV